MAEDKALLEAIQAETGETLSLVKQASADVAGLKRFEAATESRLKYLEERSSTRGGARSGGAPANGGPGGAYKASIHDIMKSISGQHGKGWSQATFDPRWADEFRAAPQDWRSKAADMTGGTDTEGGYWIPDYWLSDIIPALTAKEVLMQAGAVDFQVDAGWGQVRFPREDSTTTGFWVGEATAPTSSGLTAGQVVATQKKAAILVKVTNDLLRMSGPGVESYLRFALTRDLGLLIDLAGLRGTGSSSQPLGVNTITNVGSVPVGTDGGNITYALLRKLVNTVLQENPPGNRLGFVMHPAAWNEILKITDEQSRPLFHSPEYSPGLPGTVPMTIFGYPVYLTTQIPTNLTKSEGTTLSEIYFGDWSELTRVMWTQMEIRLSQHAYDGTDSAYTQDLTFFLALCPMDWVIRHAKSFALIPDVKIN